ncbi:VOC family protein [Paenibacillus thermotolerans]|uniref:VOC family protein n=1 Tax=Paenibacillus thermotolerans TaxID=3027807 RepID=UPI002367A56E|nr:MULTISPECIES: VOC family protein [unclassified Paenibacillus]
MGFQCQVPIIPVYSMDESLAFYRDVLGFDVAWVWEDNGYAAVRCGDIELHLDVQESFTTYRAHSYFFVDNADEMYAEYKIKGVDIVQELEHKPWEVKEFTFRDLNGHMFKVAQQI